MILPATEKDSPFIHSITLDAGVFSADEVECVTELWEGYMQLGPKVSGYYFVVEQEDDIVRGYACYGPRSLTHGTYDLYWIAVDPQYRRAGVGRRLLDWVEDDIRRLGGRLIVIETSGLEKYRPTRNFYLATGYIHEATLKNFYQEEDDLIIFTKHI